MSTSNSLPIPGAGISNGRPESTTSMSSKDWLALGVVASSFMCMFLGSEAEALTSWPVVLAFIFWLLASALYIPKCRLGTPVDVIRAPVACLCVAGVLWFMYSQPLIPPESKSAFIPIGAVVGGCFYFLLEAIATWCQKCGGIFPKCARSIARALRHSLDFESASAASRPYYLQRFTDGVVPRNRTQFRLPGALHGDVEEDRTPEDMV